MEWGKVMKFVIAATFKSNKTKSQILDWVSKVLPAVQTTKAEIAVAPAFVYISDIAAQLTGRFSGSLSITAQDVSPYPPGSYTGAVNAAQLADLGVKYCVVGHSERRKYFHETHAEIANKIAELVGVGIVPILCLAEDDIFPGLAAIAAEYKDKIIYCYEPPADIGGTETAPVADIERVVGLIRTSVDGGRVMYGGSVNGDNISSLIPLSIDGVLVSSASLDPDDFIRLVTEYARAEKK